MELERKQDLSIYYWLDGLMQPYPMVNVNDGFPEGDLELPSVTIESDAITPHLKEMGSRVSWRRRFWIIDVIALNKAQRDELTSIILNDIENGISVYNYDEGFPPGVSPTEVGLLSITDWDVRTIRVFPTLVEKMYWRNTIRFFTEYNAK
jgi:hypothetical protein